MEIVKYKKTKNNTYELTLDNGSILHLFDDIIIKYELLIKKSITNEEIAQITLHNEQYEAYYKALSYLNKKHRSELEIEKYLTKAEYNKKSIAEAIKKLTDEGYLNKKIYLTSYINDQINLTNNGPEKIKYNLINLGFSEDEIEIDYDFSKKIENLIAKKVRQNHKLSSNNLKLNLTHYLINQGYPKDMFAHYLDDIKVDNRELIKKDYTNILKKYQNKYTEKKLSLVIKDKLYKKGYNVEEISEVMRDD